MSTQDLTPSQVLAAAATVLTGGGYEPVDPPEDWDRARSRLFEDQYGIVALFVYETWSELAAGWPAAQGELVDIISTFLGADTARAWEGYLVLLTPGRVPLTEGTVVDEIRYDTTRVRKLVATGEDITVLDDIMTAVMPLLPLSAAIADTTGEPVLDQLASLLTGKGIDPTISQAAVEAFAKNESILEYLHALHSPDPL